MHNTTELADTAERKFIEAIALKRLVLAEYNSSELCLAPHQLFSRHGELFVSALNTRKNWSNDDERRLGYFKLDGLSRVTLTAETFELLPSYDGGLPREGDEELFSISAT